MGCGAFARRFGFDDSDSKKDCCEQTEKNQHQKDRGGDGLYQIETATQKNDDTDTAGGREGDGGTPHTEETEKERSIAGDGDEQQSAPKKSLGEMEKRSWRHSLSRK